MTPQSALQSTRRYLDVIALCVALLTAVGYKVISPTSQIEQLQKDVAEIRSYAEAAAVDLCLTRPDSTLARMRLNCRQLLSK